MRETLLRQALSVSWLVGLLLSFAYLYLSWNVINLLYAAETAA